MKRTFNNIISKLTEDMAEAIYNKLPYSGRCGNLDLEVFVDEKDDSVIQIKWGDQPTSRLEYVPTNHLACIVDHIINETETCEKN